MLGWRHGLPLAVAALAVLAVLAVAATGCEPAPDDAREAQIVAVLAAADEPYVRARPALSAGKYARMASGVIDFYRGTVPLFRSDMRTGSTTLAVSRFDLDVPLVPSIGDPHPENFGGLRAPDGTLAIEPNDFDTADRAPYLWDLRRLAVGLALAALASNPDDADAHGRVVGARRAIVRSAIAGYRAGIEAAARGEAPARVTAATDPILASVIRRSERDHARRRELTDLTVLDGDRRVLLRGPIDPEDPQKVYADLPPFALAELPGALERWRRTLVAPPPEEHVRLLDAVRVFGSGVASWPRTRVVLLVRGPTDAPDDDWMLELKELGDSMIGGLWPPGVHADSVGERVVRSARMAWARPDAEPFWGWTTWLGLPCQIRLESEGHKGVRVARMVGEEGTPEALTALGAVLGDIVARVHASGPGGIENARAVYARIAIDPEGFLDEQADACVAYAELVVADHLRFARSLHRPDGLRLGIPFDPSDAPRPDIAAVFGVPPPLPPLPSSP
ncbi:MAG: DUF2252 family protein [Labilithrix sp.]|nr:DUF2252 family protein [Labilithrix sp.]